MEYTLSQMLEKLKQSQSELTQMLDGSSEAALHQPHGDEKWSLAIMLAHLTEARPFFTEQAKSLLLNPSVSVGRTLDNEQRVDAIIQAQRTQLTRSQLKKQLKESYETATGFLNSLNQKDLEITCNHVRLGAMTLGEFLQRSLVDHDQAHVEQAQTLLE